MLRSTVAYFAALVAVAAAVLLRLLLRARELCPEIILLDIGLPKVNGYDACRQIRAEPWGRAIVLVALTGWGQDSERRRSREAGFGHHLVKPVDPDELMTLLKNIQPRPG